MSDIRVEVEGDDEKRRNLERLAFFMIDLRPFWPKIIPLWIGWMEATFATEGAFWGARWASLSPGYAAWKAANYPGRGILYATGAMRRASSMPRRMVMPRSLILTIVDPKIGYHQEGTPRMPRRPVVGDRLPAVAQAQVQSAADEYVEDLARRLGLL